MLELTGEHIQKLSDEDLRLLVVKLCAAELRRSGHPVSGVTAGGNQTAADGGLDVRVEIPSNDTSQLDFIQRPITGFQVKCQDMPAAEIASEMRPKGKLRPVIKSLIAQGGAYIVVSSKGSVADAALQRRRNAMQAAVASEAKAVQLKLDFYDRERLAGWVREYAGVEMWLRDRVDDRLQGWRSYGCWTSDRTNSPYLHDAAGRLIARTSGSAEAMSAVGAVDVLRQKLTMPGSVVRLIGLSGTGKTRLVQALFEPGVGNSEALDASVAVYTDLGNSPEPSARDMLLRLGSLQQRAIVVIDNCNPSTHRSLTELVAQYSQHLSLITVEYDVADDEPEGTEVFELTPSSDEVLEGILARLTPHVAQTDRSRIASFSGGNARVALALARTVQQGDTLATLNDAELFRRLFMQNQGHNDDLLRAAEACSLVYSFDGEDITSESAELRALSSLAACSPRDLYRYIATLRQRDIVQVRGRWRAVLPHALANRLAKSALQGIPRSVLLDAVGSHERLLRSFSRRLGYLHDSEEACAIAERWIDDEKWLANPTQLNELGVALFFNLAPLVPSKVLSTLESAVQGEQGREFTSVQQPFFNRWLTLSRNLAYEVTHFERAARVILAFAEAEDNNRTDARTAWKEVFHVVLSGTLAPPEQRGAFLRELLREDSLKRRQLAIEGVSAMLKCGHFSASHDVSFGARSRGFGWAPRMQADFLAWYGIAFALVREVARLSAESRDAIRAALASEFRQLWDHDLLRNQLIDLTREFAEGEGWPGGWIAVRSALRFEGATMSEPALQALNELEALLSPKSVRQQILSYALSQAYGALDIADAEDTDDATEDANPISAYERVTQRAISLGEAAAADREVLTSVLSELLLAPDGRQQAFGVGVGRATTTPKQHWVLFYDTYAALDVERRNPALLSGFLRGLRISNKSVADELLDGLVTDSVLGPIFPYIQGWPSDDTEGDRLLLSVAHGQAPARRFYLGTTRLDGDGLSVAKYGEVVRRVATMPDGLSVAIDSVSMEYHWFRTRRSQIPEPLVLLGRDLLGQFMFDFYDHNLGYRLKELAKVCFQGDDAATSVRSFASRFAAALDNYRTHADAYGELACVLFRLHPTIALDIFLSRPSRKRLFPFRSRFELTHGRIVECAPTEEILAWIDAARDERLPLVGAEIEVLDKAAVDEPRLSDLAARLLAMATDKGPLLESFGHHFNPSGWSGSLEQTLRPYIGLAARLSTDSAPEVAAWASRQLSAMRKRIEVDRRTERVVEERFE